MWVYGGLYALLGFVEGIILVATPALTRDFSPQMGRASAMGFWTMGPVIASLTVAMVSSHTLAHLHAWQDQFLICGIVGLVVFRHRPGGVARAFPRPSAPAYGECPRPAARGGSGGRDRCRREPRVPVAAGVASRYRGLVLGIGVFLIIYYTLIAFLVVYMATIFGYIQRAAAASPNEWRRWWWVCVAVEAFLLPFIFLMKGRWSPKRARQDEEMHANRVAEELAAISVEAI